jgi:hypothetical protein
MNRLTALPVIGSAFLAACAAPPDEISSLAASSVSPVALVAAADPPASAAVPPAGDVVVIEVEDLATDTGLVCEPKRRSGSRIARTVCTTREALAATEQEQAEAARKYARDLDRERAMKAGPTGEQQRGPAIIAFQ